MQTETATYFVSDRLYVSAALGRGPWEDPDFHGFLCSLPMVFSGECARNAWVAV